jgi:hypothetical protein
MLDDPQDTSQVGNKMTTYSWRDLTFDKVANTHLLDHFCRRGTLDKDLSKPARSALFQLILKNMVASGELVIDRFEEGIPILSRGHCAQVSEDVAHVPHVSVSATPETLQPLQSQSQPQPHTQQTPSQLALEDANLAKLAYVKATRIAQERTQEAAQEAERIKQDATADSRKAKKEERYRATMAKLGKLPPCPKICRGEECSGIPCEEEELGFTYKHLDDMVVCQDKAHLTMATRDGCLLFHLWPARKKRSPKPPAGPPAGHPAKNLHPAKNSGGGTSGARQAPAPEPQQPECGEATSRRKGDSAAAAAAASRVAAAAAAKRPRPPKGDQEAEP